MTSGRFGVTLVVALILTVGACTPSSSESATKSIRQAAQGLVGDDGLIMAPEADSASFPDLYLTAVAMEMLGVSAPSVLRPEQVSRSDRLPEPWATWTLSRVLGGTPAAPVTLPKGRRIPKPPVPTGDDDADAVMLWAWSDASERLTSVPGELKAEARATARALNPAKSWYSRWRLMQAAEKLGATRHLDSSGPGPNSATEDVAFEALGYIAIQSHRTLVPAELEKILRRDLDWPVCSVESLAAARAMKLLGDPRGAERRLGICLKDADSGVLLNVPIRLGSVPTTFAVAELLNDDFAGLLSKSSLDSLEQDLALEQPSAKNRSERLQKLAILHMSKRSVGSFEEEIKTTAQQVSGRHEFSEARELATQVAALRRLQGQIDLPTLVGMPREEAIEPEAARFVLATSDRYANGAALVRALPRAQRTALADALVPSATLSYYRAVAALPAVDSFALSESEQDRVAKGLATLRGCALSPYLYRVAVRAGEAERCSFTMSLLARTSSFEGPPR